MIYGRGAEITVSRKGFFPSLRLCAFALSLLILILLLAFALRVHLLGAQSLWNDEGSSYVQATRSLADIARFAALDIHPPGYYWLLHVWRILTGDTEFALRALSAFASLLSVAVAYALGKRLYGALAGLAAALFVALNGFSLYYAQEARMYALLALWGAAGFWALVGLLTAQRAVPLRRWQMERASGHSCRVLHGRWRLALVNAAGLWTQYAYPFVMLAQGGVCVCGWGRILWMPGHSGRCPYARWEIRMGTC